MSDKDRLKKSVIKNNMMAEIYERKREFFLVDDFLLHMKNPS